MIKDKKPYNLLVIEDNLGDYMLVEEFIGQYMHNVKITHALNFKNTLVKLNEKPHLFDLILMDLTLPDKSGEDLVTEMLRLLPNSPIIILTGYTDIDFSIQSISRGISDYLIKDDLNGTMLYKSITYAIERKKITALLEDSEKRYSNLFHLSPQPMWLYDIESLRFLQVNKAAIEHYGYSNEEFLNMQITDIRSKEDAEKSKAHIEKRVIRGESSFKGSSNHVKKSGEVINVEIYITHILINERLCRSVIAFDVTERNEYENRITKAIIKTQEEERYEIGGELHDNVCQILATSMITLGMMKKHIDPAAGEWFESTKQYINMASDEIRNLSHRLAPAFFDDSSFEVAIEVLFNSFNVEGKYQINIEFDDRINNIDLNLEMQLNLYRILQEQLRNIMKYAHATVIDFSFFIDNAFITLKLRDNGVGFNTDTLKSGIGHANMRRRTELFSGTFVIQSSPGNGCNMIVTIPIAADVASKN
jgi:PAS domain S-box-containing protein